MGEEKIKCVGGGKNPPHLRSVRGGRPAPEGPSSGGGVDSVPPPHSILSGSAFRFFRLSPHLRLGHGGAAAPPLGSLPVAVRLPASAALSRRELRRCAAFGSAHTTLRTRPPRCCRRRKG